MSEPVKFTNEEIKEVEDIRNGYMDIQNQFGQSKLARIRLEQQLINLDNQENELSDKLNGLQDKEQTFLTNLTEKYGQGSLDPETGIFTPDNS